MWKGLVAPTSLSTETAAAAVVLPLGKDDGGRRGEKEIAPTERKTDFWYLLIHGQP